MQPEPCCDIKSVSRHHPCLSRSRHQNQVATFLEATLCRDINFMSRHRFCPQWAFQVATPKFHVATSLGATHVATSKLMSRPQVAPQIQVTTLSSLNQVATSLRCRDFKSPNLCHDMKFMSQPRPTSPSLNQTRSRPQIWVATQHWNLAVAIPASALHQNFFSFFFKSSSSFLATSKMQ